MDVIRQQNWTDKELSLAGFEQYDRIKQVVMVRRLSAAEAPLTIATEWGETLVATIGYAICYRAGEVKYKNLNDYYHWPVEPYVFDDTYRPWDQRNWSPTETEKHLLSLGCRPYYKLASVWAKKITHPLWMQSPEHNQPVEVGPGRYLIIGAHGEPYTMGQEEFYTRYIQEEEKPRSVVEKLLSFFRR